MALRRNCNDFEAAKRARGAEGWCQFIKRTNEVEECVAGGKEEGQSAKQPASSASLSHDPVRNCICRSDNNYLRCLPGGRARLCHQAIK